MARPEWGLKMYRHVAKRLPGVLLPCLLFLALSIPNLEGATNRWIEDPAWGFGFTLPEGWKIVRAPGGGTMLGLEGIPGALFLFPHRLGTIEAVGREMAKGMNETGAQLRLVGSLRPGGKGCLLADYEGTLQGYPGRARAFGIVLANGAGAIIMAAAFQQVFSPQLGNAVEILGRRLRSKTPPKAPKPFAEKKAPAARSPFAEKKAPAARSPFAEKKAPAARSPFAEKKPPAARSPFAEKKPPAARSPFAEGCDQMQ